MCKAINSSLYFNSLLGLTLWGLFCAAPASASDGLVESECALFTLCCMRDSFRELKATGAVVRIGLGLGLGLGLELRLSWD